MRTSLKRNAALAFLSLFAFVSTASAVPFVLSGSTLDPDPGVDYFNGSGDVTFNFTVDPDTNRITGDLKFLENSAGSLANFFFVSLTSGPMPGAGDTATLVFDYNNGVPLVSVYEYNPDFEGATNPLVEAFSGDLLFSSLNGDAEILSASGAQGMGMASYQFEIDSTDLPMIDFSDFAGVWLQSMGLNQADGTFVTYGPAGRIVAISADIDSDGSYGWYDGELLQTEPVPEPATILLLGGALGMLRSKRKRN